VVIYLATLSATYDNAPLPLDFRNEEILEKSHAHLCIPRADVRDNVDVFYTSNVYNS